jgi:hypothetical protein
MTLRGLAAPIFVLTLGAYAYFYQGGGWNQNSRFALVRALAADGTVRIDRMVVNGRAMVTGDFARAGGHIYSDKAPGLALAAVPVVAAVRPFVPENAGAVAFLSYLATLAVAAVPTALTALLVLALGRASGASAGAAVFAALTFALGTPAWCYATLLFGHALATLCLVAGFAAALRGGPLVVAFGCGAALGWGTITEYPTVVPAAIVALLAVLRARSFRTAAALAAGALVPLVVLLVYNRVAFGSFVALGYSSVEGWGGMREGVLGVTYPKLPVLGAILVGAWRGLLPLAPVLALAPLGAWRLPRQPALIGAAIVVYYLLFNAAYHYWNGGWSYGPRHIAPALPFLAIALAPLWDRARGLLRAGLAALAAVGAAMSLVAVSVTAQPNEAVKNPIVDLYLPSFAAGRLGVNWQGFLEAGQQSVRDPVAHAWNLGEKVGLSGLWSLVPLALFFALCGLWLLSRLRDRVR